MNLPINKPQNIEITKAKDEKFKKASEEIDGPGHNPDIPQPMPKTKDPIIRDLSIFFLEGKLIFSAKIIELFFVKK